MASAIGEYFLGRDDKFKKNSPFNSQQNDLLKQIGPYAFQNIQKPQSDPFAGLGKGVPFGPIADQAKYNFATETVPQLSERFAGADALRSSGFQGTLGSAGAGLNYNLASLGSQHELQNQDLMQRLAGLRSSHQNQQQVNLQNLLNSGLQQNYQLSEHKGSPGAIESGTGALFKILYMLFTGGLG